MRRASLRCTATRAGRLRAQHELNRLLAARRRAAMASGPGGPWAIPWPVVQCESGGQNLPPNSATASGYYQITDATWHGLGGSTKHAYQASKAEQDRLAAASGTAAPAPPTGSAPSSSASSSYSGACPPRPTALNRGLSLF